MADNFNSERLAVLGPVFSRLVRIGAPNVSLCFRPEEEIPLWIDTGLEEGCEPEPAGLIMGAMMGLELTHLYLHEGHFYIVHRMDKDK